VCRPARDGLVAALSRDNGVHPYAKWQGAFWRLISLVDIGVEPGHPGAVAAAEQTLAWIADPAHVAEVEARVIDGRVRRHASMEGRTLQASLDVGLRGDPRLDVLAESLVRTQLLDGGWNSARHRDCVHSSFHESWGPIFGLARYGARDAVERGAEFLLEHRVVFSHRTGEPAHPAFLRIRFPAYWHYDVLTGVRTLAAAGAIGDPRAGDALDLLESKRRADGAWRTEGKWWKRPGTAESNVEAVDWGDAANEVLTEQAEAALRAAGRL
jgi:hypothetical protein